MKKGFTLIELLATLVILGIIMVITIPQVMDTISSGKKAAFLRSSENIVRAAELKYASDETMSLTTPYTVTYEDGVLVGVNDIKFRGSKPDFAIIKIGNLGVVKLVLWNNSLNKCIFKDYNDETPYYNEEIVDKDGCMALMGTLVAISYPQVTDTNPGIICGNTATENYAGNSSCYIRSIEDMAAFSNLAKTNTFSGKTIYLENNLDFQSTKSYIDSNTTIFGDINGNTTVESLKTELTTGFGFYPIGINTLSFSGTFIGNAKYIKNLYINRSARSYVGLFGHVTASTIRGINLYSVNVTGGQHTGSIVGNANNLSVVSSIYANGTVTGAANTGGIIGYLNGISGSSSSLHDVLFDGNVSGANNTGGVVGLATSTYTFVDGVAYLGGNVTGVTNYGRVSGINAVLNAIGNSSSLVNSSTVSSTSLTSLHGKNFNNLYKNDLNILETGMIDTYISGDDYVDGFYFDYNSAGDVAVATASATITMSGAGTVGDPYLIANYDDFKTASLNQTAYYRLTGNIDFFERKMYMLSSSQNVFMGNFDGNGKTLSNISINGLDYTGLFGRINSGTIYNLKIDGIIVNGLDNTGGLVGYQASGANRGITISNANITGQQYTGGLVGNSYTSSSVSSVLISGTISGGANTGGVMGNLYGIAGSNSTLYDAIFEGTVTGGNYTGGVIGYKTASYATASGLVNMGGYVTGVVNSGRVLGISTPTTAISNSSVILNGSTAMSTNITSINGKDFSNADKNDINICETGGLDTYIGGDNLVDGYYFDYDSENKLVVTVANGSITMAGAGTVGDPYLITNYDDLKESSLNQNVYYKLSNDISLLNKNTYMLASNYNIFMGNFNGNGKTLSNIAIKGLDYTGLFGRINSGTIYNLKIDGIIVNGLDNTGGLIGYQAGGTNKGITISNADITGKQYTGGLIGNSYSGTSVSTVHVSGTISGDANTGGVMGNLYGISGSSSTLYDAIFEGTVIGGNYTGGVLGLKGSSYTAASGLVNIGGYVTGVVNSGRVVGLNAPTTAISNSSVILNGSTAMSTNIASANGKDFSNADKNDINICETGGLDTYIGGDDLVDGYYFDYDAENKLVVKVANSSITMAGLGTAGSPYLITNYDDLKEASLNQSAYYRLSNDISLLNKNTYMLASNYNIFQGNFDGNGKTLSNISINGLDYTGLFGSMNSGAIYNLTINQPAVKGLNYTGGLVGNHTGGTITGINVTSATVNGSQYTGGLVGTATSSTVITSVIVKGDITGAANTGGVVGYLVGSAGSSASMSKAMFEGDVSGANNTGGVIGLKASTYSFADAVVNLGGTVTGVTNYARVMALNAPTNAIALSTILVNGSTVTSGSLTSVHGRDTTVANLLVQATYTGIGFNFTDTTPGTYIWKMSGSTIWVEKN